MPASRAARHRPGGVGNRTLVALIGCYLMLQPLATDFYLASLPGIARTFATSAATVQLTLSVFVATFGAMQLVVGPLSDRFGRYPVLLTGLALYGAAAVACAAAPTIGLLVGARFVQAAGCCAAVVVARAIIRDAYDPRTGARVMAQASSVLAIGPLLGPILGSYLEVRFGFRAVFIVVALMTGGLGAFTLARLGETHLHPNPAATRPRTLLANYAAVLREPAFRAYTLVASASYGGLFALISGASIVLIRLLGVPTAYFGFCWSFMVLGYLIGTIVCRRLLTRHSVPRTLQTGAALALASGLLFVGLAAAGVQHWAAIVGPGFVYFLAHGINFPASQAGSVAPFPRLAGAAAGMFGFLMMVAAALVGVVIGATQGDTAYPLVLAMGACSAVTFATVWGRVARLPAMPEDAPHADP